MEEATNGRRRTLKIKAFGVEAEVRGYDIIIILILIGIVVLIVANYYTSQAFATEHQKIVENQSKIANTQDERSKKNEEQLAEVVYILSLSEKEKVQLKLKIPNSLKEKLERNNK